jgi:hypothetical protein
VKTDLRQAQFSCYARAFSCSDALTLPTNRWIEAKARDAARQLEEKRREFLNQRATQRLGPSLVAFLALFVFVFTQASFYFGWPLKDFPSVNYMSLTFGSLIFIIASLYLPSTQRLKLAGVELEKRPVDQTPNPLSIRR